MKNRAKNLLSATRQVLDRYREKELIDGEAFNLIRIMGVNTDEVKICRLLAEIINPNGKHGKGKLFLKLFADKVLEINVDENELETAKVYTEYHTYGDRRIDIVIVTARRFIPLEVKIYASDQPKQCRDYYDFAVKQKKEVISNVYYLTLDGHLPQGVGCAGLTPITETGVVRGYKEIIPISFSEDICHWLDKCIEETEKNTDSMINANLKQLKDVLMELCGNMNKEMAKEISEIIECNEEKFKVACAISESVKLAKENMMRKLLSVLKEKIEAEEFPIIPIENKYDFRQNNFKAIKNYYNSARRCLPGFSYLYKRINRNKEIWLRVEIDHNLFFGFVIAEKGENPGYLALTRNEIAKHIGIKNDFYEDSWWFYWEYLLNDDETETPNFMNNNDVLANLFNENYFEEFTNKCVRQIKVVIKEMELK